MSVRPDIQVITAQIMKRDRTLQKVFSDSLESVSGVQVKYSREDKKEDR